VTPWVLKLVLGIVADSATISSLIVIAGMLELTLRIVAGSATHNATIMALHSWLIAYVISEQRFQVQHCCPPTELAMVPKRKNPPPPPKPPGLVASGVPVPPPPKKAKAASKQQSPPPPPWDPEEVADKPKHKNWWDKGAKGRKKKLRAVEHWLSLNQVNFRKMAECDFTKRALPASASPSSYFRRKARRFEIIRYFCFLFQMVLLFIRVWKPTRQQMKHYGLGVQTAARRALLMMHTGELPQDSVTQLTSLKRYLFNRVARETENLAAFNKVSEDEHTSDGIMSVCFRIRDHIDEVMLPALRAGKFPKFNLEYDALSQYSDCWEVHPQRIQVGVFRFKSASR